MLPWCRTVDFNWNMFLKKNTTAVGTLGPCGDISKKYYCGGQLVLRRTFVLLLFLWGHFVLVGTKFV